jgi:hypothetical protein
MSNHKNLVFFNKEGDSLNFSYDDINNRFEGDILFHENSSDTYKTYGIYTLEKIPTFEFERPSELTLEKFQLFNELGFHFYGSSTQSTAVLAIEPVNNDPTFYSKWIYGYGLDSLYPIGSMIAFETRFLEFQNLKRTYCVVGNKKDAIMIISDTDNATFDTNYYGDYSTEANYYDIRNGKPTFKIFIKGMNSIGIYDYIDSEYQNNISFWSEPNFYERLFIGQKLTIDGTSKNDGVVTVTDDNLVDPICFEYFASALPQDTDLIIEYRSKTDALKVYEGEVSFLSDSKVVLKSGTPIILKPGAEFRVVGTQQNDLNFTISQIPSFEKTNAMKYYGTASQVMYNSDIYECIQAYTHSISNNITPTNRQYWILSNTLPVNQPTSKETLSKAQVYLTTDKQYFTQTYTQSSSMTLAAAASIYKEDLKALNVDLYYKNGVIKADLIYPSEYAQVEFYAGSINNPIGKVKKTNERLIGIREQITNEFNYDFSENFRYNIVFTDIDSYGIKLVINKETYEEEAALIYSGPTIDMERTIDKTLRSWYERNYIRLHLLGIETELAYIGPLSSPFYNSIIVSSYYPNVPLVIDRVEVGTTANYHIEHSRVLFTGTQSMGPYLNLNINGRDYGVSASWQPYSSTASFKIADIPGTLERWVAAHGPTLEDYGLIATSINNLLKFDVRTTQIDFSYTLTTGKLYYPGATEIIFTDKIKGNRGALISANLVLLPSTSTASFLDAGFSTGMISGLNNTIYPYNNQEYNLVYVSDHKMNLSYQGPFWGLTDSLCTSSPYVTISFNSGFGQTACVPLPTFENGSPFEVDAFTFSSFTKYRSAITYSSENLGLTTVPGSSNMVDLKYVQISDSIYVLGDNLIVLDAIKYEYLTYVTLSGNTDSIKLEYNQYNNYLYCLSKNKIWIVDPLINVLMSTITLSYDAKDISINQSNGDIYVSYSNSPQISIFDWTNTLVKSITTPESGDTMTGMMTYNSYQEDVYVTTDGEYVHRINGFNRSIQDSIYIPGLTSSRIFYEPAEESIFVWSDTNIWRIESSTYSMLNTSGSSFADAIYNNITGEINISDTGSFLSIELVNNSESYNTLLSDYGYIVMNQSDGLVYMSSQATKTIFVLNPSNGYALHSEPITIQSTKIIYNPARKSIWTIQPGGKSILEVKSYFDTSVVSTENTGISIDEFRYGSLSDAYQKKSNFWIKTREFFRKPRENFSGEQQVEYYWKWLNDQIPEFFIYDLSGDMLPTTGSYSYIGPKPLTEAPLNKLPNKDVTKRALPQYQQTVFDMVSHKLDYINSDTDITSEPEAIQVFLGFKCEEETPKISMLQLFKKEDISVTITPTDTNNNKVRLSMATDMSGATIARIDLDTNSTDLFTESGLKKEQLIALYFEDKTNLFGKYISPNHGSVFTIKEIYSRSIILNLINSTDFLATESNIIENYPDTGKNTYVSMTIKVLDREIGRFFTYGQTEIEDVRFKTNLTNMGKNVEEGQVFIFKNYDIYEGGVDWKFLNQKRKEMLMMRNEIYMYIGAYKSIINAINYFGYNDLKLNEYYRNINPSSKDFNKLFKVEIPDIFDNSIPGWNDLDFIKDTFPNENYSNTNLFNLTFDITDKDGNNLSTYSLEEIIVKLQGLKFWLSKNIIPMTHKILDITGTSYAKGPNQIVHRTHDLKIFNIREESTPIMFRLSEAYLMPVNSGSTVYNCVIDFHTIIKGAGEDVDPYGINPPPRPVEKSNPRLPDSYDIKIRTYQTYKEWAPFTTYAKGDRVIYYGVLYESTISPNRINNPRKYESVQTWSESERYETSNIVEYQRRIYSYSGLGSSTGLTTEPLFDQGDGGNWVDVTEWIEIDFTPVQTITEFRRVPSTSGMTYSKNPLPPFNFTIDSNIDPFVTIEVTSDNGYGGIYRDKKNYEIRGLKDLTDKIVPIESIGPFRPIPLIK